MDSFKFSVNDGTLDSDEATVSITVSPVNDKPVADPQSVATSEDTANAITLAASDVDGDPLTYTVTGPSHGALSGTAPNVTYTPNPNYNGNDSFTFKVNDGTVDSDVATVSITLSPVNDAPVANSDSVATNEDTAQAIVLTGSDIDRDSLSFSIASGAAHGTLSGTAPNLTYTPNANFNGSDSFQFKVNDGTTNSANATVSINVSPVNDPPVADAQSLTTNEDSAKPITLTGSDIDGDALTLTITANPAHGVLGGIPPNVTYTPVANYNGGDSIKFKVNDGQIDSAVATVSITVSPVNDTPVAASQSVTTVQNTAKAII
ncbi:MAG: adhesin, partial [Verrucomicrobia bacterium]